MVGCQAFGNCLWPHLNFFFLSYTSQRLLVAISPTEHLESPVKIRLIGCSANHCMKRDMGKRMESHLSMTLNYLLLFPFMAVSPYFSLQVVQLNPWPVCDVL